MISKAEQVANYANQHRVSVSCCCSVRSPQWLRGKWWSMKRHVSGYQDMTFPGLFRYQFV